MNSPTVYRWATSPGDQHLGVVGVTVKAMADTKSHRWADSGVLLQFSPEADWLLCKQPTRNPA